MNFFRKRKLEKRKYVYGVTVPTNGEIKEEFNKNYSTEDDFLNDIYLHLFESGANYVINKIIDYSIVPSDDMIDEQAKKPIDLTGYYHWTENTIKIFKAGADYVRNYQIEKDAKKYNL